jgi:hypothetical protein
MKYLSATISSIGAFMSLKSMGISHGMMPAAGCSVELSLVLSDKNHACQWENTRTKGFV